MKPQIRVVLDTNCLVSALVFSGGSIAELRNLWKTGFIIPLVCKETVNELIRVLAYPKFHLARHDLDILLGEFLPYTESFVLTHIDREIDGLTDPDDAVFICLAREAKTDFLVSGDRHILGLKEFYPMLSIIPPADFIQKFQK